MARSDLGLCVCDVGLCVCVCQQGRQVWMATPDLGLPVLFQLLRTQHVSLVPILMNLVQQTAPSWGALEIEELMSFVLGDDVAVAVTVRAQVVELMIQLWINRTVPFDHMRAATSFDYVLCMLDVAHEPLRCSGLSLLRLPYSGLSLSPLPCPHLSLALAMPTSLSPSLVLLRCVSLYLSLSQLCLSLSLSLSAVCLSISLSLYLALPRSLFQSLSPIPQVSLYLSPTQGCAPRAH